MHGDNCWVGMYTRVWLLFVPPLLLPINQVNKYGMPTWRRLVTAVQCHAGGNNPALAQTIATEHSGVPGSQSDTLRLCRRTKVTVCMNGLAYFPPQITLGMQTG